MEEISIPPETVAMLSEVQAFCVKHNIVGIILVTTSAQVYSNCWNKEITPHVKEAGDILSDKIMEDPWSFTVKVEKSS